MADFAVEGIEVVKLDIAERADGLLAGHDLMSPYVWRKDGGGEDERTCHLLVRVLKNPLGADDPTGVIYAGESSDGLFFTMKDHPAIAPGPDDVDAGGVEDPTTVLADKGGLLVFYTGGDARRSQG